MNEHPNELRLDRGRRLDDGSWVEGFIVQHYNLGRVFIIPNNYGYFRTIDETKRIRYCYQVTVFMVEVDPETVTQQIGIKDNYNEPYRDLYKGDLVQLWCDGFKVGPVREIRYWAHDNYPAYDVYPPVDYIDSNALSHFANAIHCEIQLVGNIFDNKELPEAKE